MQNENNTLRNILVVDDNEGNLLLVRNILKNKYNVISTYNSEEALGLINIHKFDLILLDVMMPVIDGFELCKIIKSDYHHVDVPIIFLTARTDYDSIVEGFEIGAVDYITKPFNKQELLAKIKNHLRLKLSRELIKQELIERLHSEKIIKDQELTLRSILEYSYDAILILETNRNIHNANLSTLAKSGYNLDEIKKLKFESLFIPENQDLILNEFDKVVENDKHSTIECFLKSKDDKIIPVEININAINIRNNKVVLSIVRDVSERKQTERRIVSAIYKTEENERARFSKDIHDGLGALLSSINIYLNMIISQNLSQAEFENFIIYSKKLVDESIISAREIANNLRPTILTRFGLVESIKSFIEKISITGKIKVDFNHKNFTKNIESDIEIIIFRIINELFNNTLKHSNSENVFIAIENNDEFVIVTYKDDGSGFDINKILDSGKQGGLHNIISRVNSISGKVNIQSDKNKGIDVRFEIPVYKK